MFYQRSDSVVKESSGLLDSRIVGFRDFRFGFHSQRWILCSLSPEPKTLNPTWSLSSGFKILGTREQRSCI